MLTVDVAYHLHTGNLFGVQPGWIAALMNAALEIGGDQLVNIEDNICPANASVWLHTFNADVAHKIQRRWNQLLPLAIHSAPHKPYRDQLIKEHSLK